MLAGQPCEIERIDWDAVAAQAGPWIERLKAERLCLRGINHFPDVDAQSVVKDLQIVDQRDVDRAIRIFKDFAGLGNFQRRDANDFFDDGAVQRGGEVEACCIEAAHDFGNRADRV